MKRRLWSWFIFALAVIVSAVALRGLWNGTPDLSDKLVLTLDVIASVLWSLVIRLEENGV